MHTCITKCLGGAAVVRVKTICPRQHAADGERAATLPIDSAEPKPVGLLTRRRDDNVARSQSAGSHSTKIFDGRIIATDVASLFIFSPCFFYFIFILFFPRIVPRPFFYFYTLARHRRTQRSDFFSRKKQCRSHCLYKTYGCVYTRHNGDTGVAVRARLSTLYFLSHYYIIIIIIMCKCTHRHWMERTEVGTRRRVRHKAVGTNLKTRYGEVLKIKTNG